MGKAKPADPDAKNNVGVKDEIGKEIIAQQKKSLKREVEMFEKQLEDLQKSYDNFKDQWLIDKRMYELHLEGDNIRKINPDFKYEAIDEFWELRKKQLQYKFRMDKHMAEAKLKHYLDQKEAVEEQYRSSLEKLNEIESEE